MKPKGDWKGSQIERCHAERSQQCEGEDGRSSMWRGDQYLPWVGTRVCSQLLGNGACVGWWNLPGGSSARRPMSSEKWESQAGR